MANILEIRRLIGNRPGITTRSLAHHFKVSEGLMSGMLEPLIQRGDIVEVPVVRLCASCSGGCDGGSCESLDCSCGASGDSKAWRLSPKRAARS